MASIRLADSMLPKLAETFGTRASDTAWVITGFTLAYGVMQLLWGPLADRYGKLRVIAGATLASSACTVICAIAPTLDALTIARVVTGAFCAAIIPTALAWIGDQVAYEHRQATLARFATGTLTGLMIGSAFGGLAADTIGWRGAFALPGVMFAAMGLWLLRTPALRAERHASRPTSAPPPGSSAAMREAAMHPLRGFRAVLVVPWALRVMSAACLEGALMFAALAFIPSFLHDREGLPLSVAGLAGAAVGLGGLLFTFAVRRLVRALGERGMAPVGGTLVAIGYVALATVPVLAVQFVACVLAGFGFYMIHNTLQAQATQMAPSVRGTALGLFAVSLFVGQSIGVALAASLVPRTGYEPVIATCGVLLAALGAWLGHAIGGRAAHGGAR